MYLAENIKFLRERADMTQARFAEEVGGVTQKTVSSWERGARKPDIETVIKISAALGVSLEDLILRKMKPDLPLYVSNLIYLRKQYDMTQEGTTKLLGYRGKQGYNAVENGKASLSVKDLEKLSDYFGVTMDQLVKQDLAKGVEKDGSISSQPTQAAVCHVG